MEKIQSITSTRAGHDAPAELVERLDTLRSQLEQIRRLAAEGQQLLAELAPQIDQFASWIVELEAVVGRWKVRDGSSQRAA